MLTATQTSKIDEPRFEQEERPQVLDVAFWSRQVSGKATDLYEFGATSNLKIAYI